MVFKSEHFSHHREGIISGIFFHRMSGMGIEILERKLL